MAASACRRYRRILGAARAYDHERQQLSRGQVHPVRAVGRARSIFPKTASSISGTSPKLYGETPAATERAWYEGSDLRALAQAAGILEACFYEPGPARIRGDVWDVQRRLNGAGQLRGVLRPAFPDLATRQDVIDGVAALVEAGINDIAFYNYGHLRQANLDWMGDALGAAGS